MLFVPLVLGQSYTRQIINVPKVDSGAITLDGQMNESVWQNAAHADLVTNTNYNIWFNPYGRESLVEPDYNSYYARMLWMKDSLYLFIHIQDIVNDSSGLYWNGQWIGDQLFVGLSDRLGRDMEGNYDGNVYAAPDGPYYFLIMADSVTLNATQATGIADMYQKCAADTQAVFYAKNIARWAIKIDTTTGTWDIEMAVYNPGINADAKVSFNLGGSQGSRQHDPDAGDAYAYYCWQPSVPDEPLAAPVDDLSDPGGGILLTSKYWAILHCTPGNDDVKRVQLDVPMADSGAVHIDGKMDEAAWDKAGEFDLVTNTNYNIWFNPYGRSSLLEPDYVSYYGKTLWSMDTLYLFLHIQDIVNDSSGLYWNGQWIGDQLFVGLSNRLGVDMGDDGYTYDGNVYAAPDGPYHYLIMADSTTLNATQSTKIPSMYQSPVCTADTEAVFYASKYAHWAMRIDTITGTWDIEMAIYNPNIAENSSIVFNVGGSQGSRQHDPAAGDAYAYYCWQPNTPDDPLTAPVSDIGDPGGAMLLTSEYWAMLNFKSSVTGITDRNYKAGIPQKFALEQNYPNPFNPTTTIRFDVAKSTNVTLKVYNILGQVVATLMNNQPVTAGYHSVEFNASSLASGIYLYRLEYNGMTSTKKMVLMK
jgi:hypothetical protein